MTRLDPFIPTCRRVALGGVVAIGGLVLASCFIFADFSFDEYLALHGTWQASLGHVAGVDYYSSYPNTFFKFASLLFDLFPLNAGQLIVAKLCTLMLFCISMVLVYRTLLHRTRNPLFSLFCVLYPFLAFYGLSDESVVIGIVQYRIDALAYTFLFGGIYLAERLQKHRLYAFSTLAMASLLVTTRPLIFVLGLGVYYAFSEFRWRVHRWILPVMAALLTVLPLARYALGGRLDAYAAILLDHALHRRHIHTEGKVFPLVSHLATSLPGWSFLAIICLSALDYRNSFLTCLLGACVLYTFHAFFPASQWFMWLLLFIPLLLGSNRVLQKHLRPVHLAFLLLLVCFPFAVNFRDRMAHSYMVSAVSLQKQLDFLLPDNPRYVVIGETFGWPLFRRTAFDIMFVDEGGQEYIADHFGRTEATAYQSYARYFEQNPPGYINLFARPRLPPEASSALDAYLSAHSNQYYQTFEHYDGHDLLRPSGWRMPVILRKDGKP
jgi:hypothetical protein